MQLAASSEGGHYPLVAHLVTGYGVAAVWSWEAAKSGKHASPRLH